MREKACSIIFVVFFIALSCQRSDSKNSNVHPERIDANRLDTEKIDHDIASSKTIDPAQAWLESIFRCADNTTGKYCYDVDQEETICTPRFMEFVQESNTIYGPSNLTDDEFPEAEARYKAKWKNVYPLYTQEMWLFGRGNDDALNIRDVMVKKLSTNKYSIFIDWGDAVKTQNVVTLVPDKKFYKIDYCSTRFVD